MEQTQKNLEQDDRASALVRAIGKDRTKDVIQFLLYVRSGYDTRLRTTDDGNTMLREQGAVRALTKIVGDLEHVSS